MRAVVGLGNVGPEYETSRHNVGFWVIARLLCRAPWRRRPYPWGEVYRSSAGYLLRPGTYMNRSGDAVRSFLDRTPLAPSDLLVVYDEADLPAGELRLRPGGGAGTHRGMRSVLTAAGTEEVPRLRVGIGRPEEGGDWVEHVLSPPRPDEAEILSQSVDLAAELAWLFLVDGLPAALDRFSRETGKTGRII